MIRKIHLFTAVLLLLQAGMALTMDETQASDEPETSSMLHKPLIKFTGTIYSSIAKKENVVLSPVSIHKALGMVLLGADPDSQTERELIETLGLKGLSKEQIMMCHEQYSKIIAKFNKVTKESLELYKAREQNKTRDESGHDSDDKKPPVLDIFNMIITKDSGDVLPDYSEKIKKYYESSIVKVDDSKPESKTKLIEKLDGWAKEAGFSQPIMQVKELDDKFAAILLSAIRVQGFWFADFHERKETKIFNNFGLKDQKVDGTLLSKSSPRNARYIEFTSADKAQYKNLHKQMTSSSLASQFEDLSYLNMRVVEVPLQGGLSFSIFDPLEVSGSGGELDKLAGQLLIQDSQTALNEADSTLGKVLALLDSDQALADLANLAFPKFDFENDIDLKGALKSAGLNRVFDRMNAELSHMTVNKLFVEKISHQAMIDVNQFGIKAAGVTKIKLALLSAIMRQEPIYVNIENPFMFMIRYGKLPLFIGQLVKL